jgi:hypothetical protein
MSLIPIFDFLYKPDEDAGTWRMVSTLAAISFFGGLCLASLGDVSSVGGVLCGLGGIAVMLISALGFRHYWNNL